MKRTIFLMTVLSFLLMGGACSKDSSVETLSVLSLSSDSFTCKGGLGSAEFNLEGISAQSSQPEWLKVQTFESTLLFNVWSNSSPDSRTAQIIVTAPNAEPIEISVSQEGFKGIYATPESINFSDDIKTASVALVVYGEFSVAFTENPDNAFSYAVDGKVVKFSVNRNQGRESVSGRAVITPADGSDPVTISLFLPMKSVYDYLIGTWQVRNNTNASGHTYPMIFSVKESQASFNVRVDAPGVSPYPFTAEFVNGKVKVSTGQTMGTDGTTYYNFHFNGPQNGSGTYIYSGYGTVAMEATPVFDEQAGTITLNFTDNGQGKEKQARDWAFWCGSRYWDFASAVAFYTNLELQKSY